jgi:galactoside O-acetyltransferase
MDINSKMHSQKIYSYDDQTLAEQQLQCLEVLYDFNQTRPKQQAKRKELMQQIFAEVGDNCYIEPPLHANWGIHTHLGNNVYANFNLTLVDDTHIYIGDDVMLGPNVTLATAGHPIDPDIRKQATQFNIPIVIGSNVWIGANTVVLPGVTIGKNTVIGAGSIVTKDIPANVVALGNPCRVHREINDHDKIYYFKKRRYE